MKKPKRDMSTYDPRWSGSIGFTGELHIASLLSGSKHHNSHFEERLPYDLTWQGIHIDVKTSDGRNGGGSYAATFTRSRNPPEDLIYVYLLLSRETNYYWVSHSNDKFLSYAHIKTSIPAEKLAAEIHKQYKKYSTTYKKTVDRQLSML